MSDDPQNGNQVTADALLRLAVQQGLLSAVDADRLRKESASSAADGMDQALETGLLSGLQVDALRMLTEREDVVPGYELLDFLGQGRYGVVFRARDRKLARTVALKVIRSEDLRNEVVGMRGKLEAQIAARFQHPNIVAAYDYGFHQGRMFLAMEFVAGENAESFVEREGPCDETFTWGVARQVASALSYASQQQVIHRDIKPANLLLTDPVPGVDVTPGVPMVKVADFGLALHETDPHTRLTSEGIGLGTPCYLAPEQLNAVDADYRADIYALGASVFHMLAGRQPFAGATLLQVVTAKQTGDQRWRDALPDRVSPATRSLFERMTAFDVKDRIDDYSELLAAIDDLLAGRGGTSPPNRSRTTRRPSRVLVIGGGAIAAGLLLGGGWYLADRVASTDSAPVPNRPSDGLPVQRELVPTGWSAYLFDGESTPISRQRGSWTAAEDEDGARVLVGREGWLTLRLPVPEDRPATGAFAVRLGVNLVADAEAELHFGRNTAGDDADSRWVVRLADGTLTLGKRRAVDGPFEPISKTEPVPLETAADDAPIYQTIVLMRQPDGWFVRGNRTRLAGIPATPSEETGQVLLVVPRGTARFADIELLELGEP